MYAKIDILKMLLPLLGIAIHVVHNVVHVSTMIITVKHVGMTLQIQVLIEDIPHTVVVTRDTIMKLLIFQRYHVTVIKI